MKMAVVNRVYLLIVFNLITNKNYYHEKYIYSTLYIMHVNNFLWASKRYYSFYF